MEITQYGNSTGSSMLSLASSTSSGSSYELTNSLRTNIEELKRLLPPGSLVDNSTIARENLSGDPTKFYIIESSLETGTAVIYIRLPPDVVESLLRNYEYLLRNYTRNKHAPLKYTPLPQQEGSYYGYFSYIYPIAVRYTGDNELFIQKINMARYEKLVKHVALPKFMNFKIFSTLFSISNTPSNSSSSRKLIASEHSSISSEISEILTSKKTLPPIDIFYETFLHRYPNSWDASEALDGENPPPYTVWKASDCIMIMGQGWTEKLTGPSKVEFEKSFTKVRNKHLI